MPITPNFSASQNAGDITVAIFEDTSTGTDGTLTARLIYLRKYDGTYLVPDGVTTGGMVGGVNAGLHKNNPYVIHSIFRTIPSTAYPSSGSRPDINYQEKLLGE